MECVRFRSDEVFASACSVALTTNKTEACTRPSTAVTTSTVCSPLIGGAFRRHTDRKSRSPLRLLHRRNLSSTSAHGLSRMSRTHSRPLRLPRSAFQRPFNRAQVLEEFKLARNMVEWLAQPRPISDARRVHRAFHFRRFSTEKQNGVPPLGNRLPIASVRRNQRFSGADEQPGVFDTQA